MKITFALPAALAAMALAGASAHANVIANWTFESDAIATNNSPTADSGTGTASSIGMNIYPTPNIGVTTDDVLVGKNSDTGANTIANTTQTWRIRGQAGSNGAANGWSNLAPIGAQGAVFTASTAAYSAINVSFDWYSTTQGEANLQLEYTTNGTTWTNVALALSGSDAGLALVTNNGSDANSVTGTYVSDNLLTNGSMAGQDWFTGLTATINDPLAANNPNFAIEMVNASTGADDVSTQGTALNNSSGNWHFDNVSISGTPVATPEPASMSLLAIGAVGLLARRRTSR